MRTIYVECNNGRKKKKFGIFGADKLRSENEIEFLKHAP